MINNENSHFFTWNLPFSLKSFSCSFQGVGLYCDQNSGAGGFTSFTLNWTNHFLCAQERQVETAVSKLLSQSWNHMEIKLLLPPNKM